MLSNPQSKYRPASAVHLPDRRWPSRSLTHAPIWLSTDLRDGNQALFEPMNAARKQRLFDQLVAVGLREIELGFPAASQIDFDFVRHLVERDLIPPQVMPMVMTPARAELVERTVASVRGARRATIHLYNATAPAWRRLVFGLSVVEVMALVREHVELVRRLTDAQPETEWVLQYSPETFCMTELEVSLEACATAIEAWGAGPGRPVVINLPTTVEVATPNVFADQIEWMDRHLPQREHLVLSVHPHNDRGTGVACAELALLAGAQRVEGCLFGNGERSGNVDLVTLALNLYAQGVHPGLDFSDIAAVARVVEDCTALPIHPRHPYVGDLVFTAFSGSHQDAIKKGLAAQADDAPWEVPYLPIDPKDLGRSYDSVIRVNSQSGKGGIAYLLEREHGLVMPRRMQVEFSAVVQRHADASEAEVSAAQLWALFRQTYLTPQINGQPLVYRRHEATAPASETGGRWAIEIELQAGDHLHYRRGEGPGLLHAAVHALAPGVRLDSHAESSGSGWAIVELAAPSVAGTHFGAGQHADVGTAAVLAVLSAATRLGALSSMTHQFASLT
jgi:2-isopropylmalate synthase